MALKKIFKPVKEAIVENLANKDPDEVIFIVGQKEYKTKELIFHFKKEDSIAETIINYALKVTCRCDDVKTLNLSQNEIEAAIKLFKS